MDELGIGLLLALAVWAVLSLAGRRLNRQEVSGPVAGRPSYVGPRLSAPWRWLRDSQSQSGRVELFFTAGCMAVVVNAWLFATLAEDVITRDSLVRYDSVFGNWLLSHATPAGSQFFFAITTLGNTAVVTAGVVLLGAWLVWRKHWLSLGVLLGGVSGGALLSQGLKLVFQRPRPDFPNAYYHSLGFAFPSGHATLGIVFYGLLAYLLVRAVPRRGWQVTFVLGAALLAFLIGFSRPYLGVHYLTDVLGGWAAGSMWLAACITSAEWVRHRFAQSRDSV